MLDIVIRFFQEGGPFMYPIAIVFAVGLAITLERFLYLGSVAPSKPDSGLSGVFYPRCKKAITSVQ